MARLTDKQRELIFADFHTGSFSQRKLAKKYHVSVSTINNLTKGLDAKNEQLVDALTSVHTQIADKTEHEANAVRKVAEERAKHIIFFQNSALKNQQMANKAVQSKEDDLNALESHSRITQRNKETVLGKDKTTEISNVNAQETKQIMVKYE